MVSVAVCDTPAGRYEFYGYVHDRNGVRLGERPQDEPQFDPGVLTEGNRTYLYTGFCGRGDKFPKIMQDGRDGESIQTRGYCDGVFEIRTSWEGEILGEIRVAYTNFGETFSTQVRIPDGVQAIYLTYRGGGNASLRSFNLQND